MLRKLLVMLASVLLLSSCSLLSPAPRSNTYILNTVPSVAKHGREHGAILVMQPTTSPIYETSDMAYTTTPYLISYFAKNMWAETPTQMLQPLIIQTLLNTHHFKAVSGNNTYGTYDYVLNSQLLELQQDFTQGISVIRLRLRAELISNASSQVIATKEFSVVIPAPYQTPYGGVIAANRATAQMLQDLARFCVRHSK
jgi:cholesterol transport system auxiliary component